MGGPYGIVQVSLYNIEASPSTCGLFISGIYDKKASKKIEWRLRSLLYKKKKKKISQVKKKKELVKLFNSVKAEVFS